MRAAYRLLSCLRQADEAYFTLANEIRYCSHDILNRYCGIDSVLIKQIDAIDAEPAQRLVCHLPDPLRTAIRTGPFPIFNAKAELRPNCDILSAAKNASEQLLIRIGSIDLGGVEKRHTKIESTVDRGDRLLIVSSPIGVSHSHAAQAQYRYLKPLLSELTFGQHTVQIIPSLDF